MTRIMQRAAGLAAAVTRSFAIDDIRRDKTGDGRTVTAYAAVFDRETEITDRDGHYLEQIDRTSFNRTLSHRGTTFGVFYNHGRTLYGTPSDRASVPLGTPTEIRADDRGLLTVTRYNKTPLADEILESIDNGDIRGQSFTGRIRRSTPNRGPFRAARNGDLTLVTRQEIELIEYGPTPFPAYDDAAIVGRRSLTAGDDEGLLRLILRSLDDDALDPIVAALGAEDAVRDEALAMLSEALGRNTGASDDGGDAGLAQQEDDHDEPFTLRLRSLVDRLETFSGTPDPGRASADTPVDDEHSAPKVTAAQAQIRSRLHAKGLR